MTRSRNLGDVVADAPEPGRTALIDLTDQARPRQWSFDDLDRAASGVARGLLGRGGRRGDRVAILAANRAEYLAVFLGTLRAGLVAVPVNLKLPAAAIEHILRDAGASLVVVDHERRPLLPVGAAAVEFGADLDAFMDPGDFAAVEPGADEVAMILYTSGSSGLPKGVPLTHAGALWTAERRLRTAPDLDRQCLLVAAPLYHMNALWVSCVVAFPGRASVVLLPRFSARAYIDAIGRHRCTWLTAVPTMMALVLQEPAALAATDRSSVRRVLLGSAPLTQALIDRVKVAFPGALVTNGWGTTESGPVAFGPHPRGVPRPDMALGYPEEGVDLRLVAGEDRDADEGVLEIRTPAMMSGYLNLPKKTGEVMTADGYYVTGDVMRRDAAGFYYFVGRADDMFVCGGENIYPGEVETMLERHPGIRQACVVPVPDEVRGAKPVAFVVRAAGDGPNAEAVKQWALAQAPPYQHPRHVEFVTELPLAGTGKVDRKALMERAQALAGASAA
jgi:acyl-CoA synthetase (AMP-forming)/AMP-acid ligase II